MMKTPDHCCGKSNPFSFFHELDVASVSPFPKRNVLLFFCLKASACPNMAILPGISGIITSPSYPGDYGDNHNCSWKIMASTGNRVKLVIHHMDIESGTNCPYDYIQIQNAVILGSRVLPGRLCGSLTSNSTFSSYNETLIVRFVTDGYITSRGFIGTYTFIPGK